MDDVKEVKLLDYCLKEMMACTFDDALYTCSFCGPTDGTPGAANAHIWNVSTRLRKILEGYTYLLEACEADATLWQHYIHCLECVGARFCTDAMELAATASSKRAIAIAKAKWKT